MNARRALVLVVPVVLSLLGLAPAAPIARGAESSGADQPDWRAGTMTWLNLVKGGKYEDAAAYFDDTVSKMLSPADLRTYVFPWHQRIVAAAHAAGKPAILHSCGNASEIMEDIIGTMRFDGKHSFEDTIQPIEAAYDQYQGRVALLGGIDVDYVIRSAPDAVYRRSREMLERAAKVGAYALGTGNSVPEYVPVENYCAMIWAAVETR